MTFLDFPRIQVRWTNVQAVDVKISQDFNTPKIIKIG